MTWISQTVFEIRVDDSGDTTYRVIVHSGIPSKHLYTEVVHDSHFKDDALAVARLTARNEIRKRP